MSADALSDVLRAIRLTGAVFYRVDVSSPWAAEATRGETIARAVMPSAEHLMSYHAVTSGVCWGGLFGEDLVRLEAGDVIVFPHGDSHIMASDPSLRTEARLYPVTLQSRLPFHLEGGGGGPDRARLVCGFLGCDQRPFNPLLWALPRVLVASERDAPPGSWLRHFIQYAVDESDGRRAGGEAMLARLSELMFVEVVRRYLASLPKEERGWLAALREPSIGRALSLLHERPADHWTLESLATGAGVSRSVLAERFTHLVGKPPMQYLAEWRMQLAAARLVGGHEKVATIAAEVGYDSEAAFSRAFKRLVGESPASFRNRRSKAEPV